MSDEVLTGQELNETTQLAIRVVSNITGVELADVYAVGFDLDAVEADTRKADWAELIQMIVDAILTIMESCQSFSRMNQHVERRTAFATGWFLRRAVLPNWNSDLDRVTTPRELARVIIQEASNTPETTRRVIHDECTSTKPDFNAW